MAFSPLPTRARGSLATQSPLESQPLRCQQAALQSGRQRTSSSSGRQQHSGARAQGLGSWDSDDNEKRVQRGGAAGPLRVFAPLKEAVTIPKLPETLSGFAAGLRSMGQASSSVSLDDIQRPVQQDMDICRQNLINVVGDRHPLLLAAANQIFSAGGKRLRPLIVFLMARATAPMGGLR
jgi:hypothetical protein